jgi:AcrR family transcriptional regulator
MPVKTTTRQIILEAAVTCIEKYGIDKVTTRKIAQEAGTNIASINYYFRSKEDLISETLSMTIKHMMEDVFAAIDDLERPFEAVLEDIVFYFLDGSRQFPGVTRAHMYRAAVQRDSGSISTQAMTGVYERLCQRAVREYVSADARKIRFLISHTMSSIMFSLLAPGFFSVLREYQHSNARNARALAKAYASEFVAAL